MLNTKKENINMKSLKDEIEINDSFLDNELNCSKNINTNDNNHNEGYILI